MASAQSFPVAPSSTDGTNTVRIDVSTLRIYLLDHVGQRMGAKPSSDNPVEQVFGAPYRLVMPSGQTRRGYADETGLLVELDVVVGQTCDLAWGRLEDAAPTLPQTDDPDAPFFLYEEQILFSARPAELPDQQLSNLGYAGDPAAARAVFAANYGSSDDATIAQAHANGSEWTA